MFSKVKCPNCGAKNSKERMVCIECGSSLTSEQVERQLSQVSTEAEVPDKTVIEQEPKEKIEGEYQGNEKVLFKTRGKLTLPSKKPEEADCFVTEGYVVIQAEDPIKIPLSCIQNFEFRYGEVYPSGTAILTFLDDLNKKHKLSLEVDAVIDFKVALAKHVEFPTSSFDKVVDKIGDCYKNT